LSINCVDFFGFVFEKTKEIVQIEWLKVFAVHLHVRKKKARQMKD